MRYFDYLREDEEEKMFYLLPKDFSRDDSLDILSYGLGATLYVPAVNGNISNYIINRKIEGLVSMVICLEDAIGDNVVKRAQENLLMHLRNINDKLKEGIIDYESIPLLFIRVRNPKHLKHIIELLGENINLITGFVFPKFSSHNGYEFFNIIESFKYKELYGMPILETKEILYKDSRYDELEKVRIILGDYRKRVLNIRVGATDFCSSFGIRRPYDKSIYDVNIISDCLLDILNYFIREEENYVISGPVWEYFSSMKNRKDSKFIRGLINEAYMDKINGFMGKTVIHPSHIMPVQSTLIVKKEEYLDALNIIKNNNGTTGVLKSEFGNKMNEIKPHLNWANKVIKKSNIYGVFNGEEDYESFLKRKL
ncbi:MAG: HpcH/HpaI aldolase/citrate lyase family protein [Anaeromicrobium sp.]|uniref:HpcH/HpaI aldolase/citrate lyase family protein n=1 Tax=Anaeromicrobium sp. TaxID=1929132 RepID=UPI0025D71A39|nr:HpcH/HpaI aldolase/citrate lyase family protein [Anaeromicrobium sp.]MCT4592848.1 HpcH/HpaI aldolase/citrate lyase family protein [Anaeromicrobium sp.]